MSEPPQRSRRLLVVALALYGCFWATAYVAEWFSDKPFYYQGRPNWVSDLAVSSTRWLPTSESLLTASALVFLLPAIVAAAIYCARRYDFDPLERGFVRERTIVALSVANAVAGALVFSFGFVRGALLIDDERAFLFQANLFAHGHVGLPTPPHALVTPMTLLTPMWTSPYPPGHSLLLAPAMLVHAEHFVPPILAGVLVLSIWSFTRDMFGPRHAALAALLAGASPFVWAIHGTMMAFSTSTTCIAVFVMAIAHCEKTGRARWLLLGGAAIGLSFITRPFEAVAIATPFAIRLLWNARAQPRRLLAALAGFLSIAWLLLAHDKLVTGSFFEMPYMSPTLPVFHIGFTQSAPYGELVHSPLQAIGDLVGIAQRLDLWALAWPGSLVLVIAGAIRRDATRGDSMLRWALVSYLGFYAIVPYAGTWDVGPTYYYALVPILVPLAVRGASALRAWLATLDPRAGRAVGWAVLAGLVVATTAIAPIRASHIDQLAADIRAPWELIESSEIGPAIVIVPPIDQRRAPGWAHGHPLTLADAHGAPVQLISPANQRELAEAVKYFGAQPVYQLVLDKDQFNASGTRSFTLQALH